MIDFLFTKVKKPAIIISFICCLSLKTFITSSGPLVRSDSTTLKHIEIMKDWTFVYIKGKIKDVFLEIIKYETGDGKKIHSNDVTYLIKNFLDIVIKEKDQIFLNRRINGKFDIIKIYMWENYFHKRYIKIIKDNETNPIKHKDNIFFRNSPIINKIAAYIDYLADSFTQIFMEDPKWCLQTCGDLIYFDYLEHVGYNKISDTNKSFIRKVRGKRNNQFVHNISESVTLGLEWFERVLNNINIETEFKNLESFDQMLEKITTDFSSLWKNYIKKRLQMSYSGTNCFPDERKIMINIIFLTDSCEIIILTELAMRYSNIIKEKVISEHGISINIFNILLSYRNEFVDEVQKCFNDECRKFVNCFYRMHVFEHHKRYSLNAKLFLYVRCVFESVNYASEKHEYKKNIEKFIVYLIKIIIQ